MSDTLHSKINLKFCGKCLTSNFFFLLWITLWITFLPVDNFSHSYHKSDTIANFYFSSYYLPCWLLPVWRGEKPLDYSNYSWSGIGLKDALGIHEIMQLREIWEIAWVVIPDFSRNRICNWLILLRLKLLTWLSEMCISYFRWSKSINSPYMIAATVKNSNCCVYIQLFEGASELHHFDGRSPLFQSHQTEELHI